MPTIDLPDDELAAVTTAIRGVIEDDRYPHAPRLDPLRAALARLDAASAMRREVGATNVATDRKAAKENNGAQDRAATNVAPAPKQTPDPKAPPPTKADKRARR